MARVIENKCGGRITQTKEKDGVNIGIVEGHIATWDVDRGDWTGVKDRFVKGAFLESIERHKETNRPVRLKDMHGRTIGGFPIETVREDEKGLFGIGEINLDVQLGQEAYALAKQGVYSDFSIGWEKKKAETKDGIREISKAEIWEGSIVDEPMNPFANITAVKGIDFSRLKGVEIKALEEALRTGIKFSQSEAKTIIRLMREADMLREVHDSHREGEELIKTMDKILKSIKEF